VSELQADTDAYLEPTPAGAFYATAAAEGEPARRLLLGLLAQDASPKLDVQRISEWSGLAETESLELLERLQGLGWLSGMDAPIEAPEGSLESILPGLLEQVCEEGKALLADHQGLFLAASGIHHETAEALSALSADLLDLSLRHHGLLARNLGRREQAWALTDAGGNGRLGFWPLHLGPQRFALVIDGRPCLNQPAFRDLVWMLARRYTTNDLWEDNENHE